MPWPLSALLRVYPSVYKCLVSLCKNGLSSLFSASVSVFFLFFFYIYPVLSQQISALTTFFLSILSVVLCCPFHVLLSPDLSMFICNLLSSLCCALVSFFCPYFLFFLHYCLSLIVVRFYNFTVIC